MYGGETLLVALFSVTQERPLARVSSYYKHY